LAGPSRVRAWALLCEPYMTDVQNLTYAIWLKLFRLTQPLGKLTNPYVIQMKTAVFSQIMYQGYVILT